MANYNLKLDREKGKYGYRDETGKWIVEPKFMKADEFERGVARVQLDGMWGFLNEDGSWLMEPELNGASPFSGELARVRKGFFFGFINRKGEWFIPPVLTDATDFENDTVAYVEDMESKCAFISNEGKMITDFTFDPFSCRSYHSLMSDGRIRAFKDGKYGFLNSEGQWAVPPIYEEVLDYEDGRAFVKCSYDPGGYTYDLIDLDGNVIMDSFGLEAFNIGFESGVAVVDVPAPMEERAPFVRSRSGVIDREGNWVVSPVFNDIRKFRNGFAITKKDGKRGVIDHKGNVVIENVYDDVKFDGDFFVVVLKKKEGLADRNGKLILPPKYESCFLMKDGRVAVKNKKGYGVFDLKGKEIIKPGLDSLPTFEGEGNAKDESKEGEYTRTKVAGKWGLADKDGKMIVAPEYDEIYDYPDAGVAMVVIKKKYGFIDRNTGEELVPAEIDDWAFFNTLTGYLWAQIKGKWGFLDTNGRRWVIEPKYEEVQEFGFGSSLLQVKSGGMWGALDSRDNWLIPPVFDRLQDWVSYVEHGLVHAKSGGKDGYYNVSESKWALPPIYEKASYLNKDLFIVKKGAKYALSDAEGNIRDDKWYDDVLQGNGVVWVKENGKYGVMDENWNWIQPPVFDWIETSQILFNRLKVLRVEIDGKMALADPRGNILGGRTYDGIYEYRDRYFIVIDKKMSGLMDVKGNLVLAPEYKEVEPFYGGLALVRTEANKYGYVGLDGKWVIEPVFDFAYSFKPPHGTGTVKLARVQVDGKYGLIDREGNWILEPKYDRIGGIDSHPAVCENGKWGYVDLYGNWIVPPVYMEADDFCNGYASVLTDEFKRLFVDTAGKLYKRKPN